MGFFSRIIGKSEPVDQKDASSLASPGPDLFALFGLPLTSSGIVIGEGSAMREPTAGAAIRLLAGVLATTRVHLFERGDKAERQRADDHPAEKLVANFSNPWTPAADLRRAMMCEAINSGASYGLVSKVRNQPREILPLPRSAVTRNVDEATGEPSYSVGLKGGGQRRYSYTEILEIRPWGGRALTADAGDAIGRAVTMANHAAQLFKNGAKPSGILTIPGKLTDIAAKRIADSWKASFGGDKTGSTAVVEEGGTYSQLTMSAVDAEYSVSMKAAQEDVARAFGVPLTLLNHLDRAVWKNPSQLSLQFLQYSMLPIFEHWQGALARCLLTEKERETYFFEFDLNSFAKADLSERFAAYSQAIASRILSPNEVRALENRGPYEGGNEYENPAITPGAAPADAPAEGGDDE